MIAFWCFKLSFCAYFYCCSICLRKAISFFEVSLMVVLMDSLIGFISLIFLKKKVPRWVASDPAMPKRLCIRLDPTSFVFLDCWSCLFPFLDDIGPWRRRVQLTSDLSSLQKISAWVSLHGEAICWSGILWWKSRGLIFWRTVWLEITWVIL